MTEIDYDPRAHGCQCDKCPFNGRIVVPPELNSGARMMLIGEGPGSSERWERKPFCGPSGSRVGAALEALGVSRSRDLHVTLSTLCTPRNGDSEKDKLKASQCCKPRLDAEIAECSAPVVFSCGKGALQSLLGETHQDRFSGTFTQHVGSGKQIMHAPHPVMAYYHTPHQQVLFEIYLKRAWDLATGAASLWQWPELHTTLDERAVELLNRIDTESTWVSFDVENIPDTNTLTCVGLSNGSITVSIPWDSYDTLKWGTVIGIDGHGDLGARARALVARILANHSIITQNGAFDIREMAHKGLAFTNGYDLMLAHSARWPQLRYGLEQIALHYHAVPRWKTAFKAYSDEKGSMKWVKADPAVLRDYNAKDALMQFLCREPLEAEMDDHPAARDVYANYMRQATYAAASSDYGIQVSMVRIEGHRTNIKTRMAVPYQAFKRDAIVSGFDVAPSTFVTAAGKYQYARRWKAFNPRSGRHLNKYFYGHLKAKPTRYSETSGEPTLDDQALSNMVQSPHESAQTQKAARDLLRYRMYNKLLTTYVDGLAEKLDNKGVFHPDFRVNAALTRRWGSFLHTIPGRGKVEDGQVVAPGLRDVFVARPGYWIVEADFSQQELRGIALLSGDKPWIEAYKTGADIHTLTAVELFGSGDKAMRALAKGFNFATNYCSADLEKAARGVWQVLKVDFPSLELWTVLRMLRTKYKKHPRMAEWRAAQYQHGRDYDYVEEPFSRDRRYFYGKVKETECYNFPIQRLGAHLMSSAMDRVWQWIDWQDHCLIIPNWHDAIYVETRKPLEAAEWLKRDMEQSLEWGGEVMNFDVDVAIGRDLGNKLDLKTWKQTREIPDGLTTLEICQHFKWKCEKDEDVKKHESTLKLLASWNELRRDGAVWRKEQGL